MGRMDEALRRAGADLGKPLASAPSQSAFVAPWAVGADGAVREREAERGAPTPTMPTIVRSRQPILAEPRTTVSQSFSPEWVPRLVTAPQPNVAIVEQFRGLAATLLRTRSSLGPGASLKVLMVTSAEAGEGKTLASLNLALTLSESYRRRVLLIDADLRRPTLRRVCQLPDGPGLSEGLKAATDEKLNTVQMTEMLTVLPAGRPDQNPMSGLTSARMRRIVDEGVEGFDWVVLDAPPIGPIADASLLASLADAVLLVVRAERTSCAAVKKAIDACGRDRILGVVLNAVSENDGVGSGYSA